MQDQIIRMHEVVSNRIQPPFIPKALSNMAGDIAICVGANGVCVNLLQLLVRLMMLLERYSEIKFGFQDVIFSRWF